MRNLSVRPSRRLLPAVVAAAVGVFGLTTLAAPAGAGPTAPGGRNARAVVVRAVPGSQASVRNRIAALGGRVARELSIIDGFAATIPAAAVTKLASDPDVLSVSPDAAMRPMASNNRRDSSSTSSSSTTTTTTTPVAAAAAAETTSPAVLGIDPTETGSMSSISTMVGAQHQWADGYTGDGIGIALIDTGVTRVAGLSSGGKVIDGPDLSFDSQSPDLAHLDSFGHGTHMAGIIAGRDSDASASATSCTSCLNSSGYSDTTKFVGIAPDAKIINVKVGATDGATDVSQVIAAIDWVVQHKDDAGLNIKVLNLSFGTNTAQPYQVDPLALATEVAWDNGIVVVAAGGNDGLAVPTLANPAYSPRILAVGADDPIGTVTRTDDVIPAFATHGTEARGVDVIAPGVSVASLRVPGSYVDTYYPGGALGTRLQLASGTSQSTAVVSGVVALLRQRFPSATPQQIKGLLKLGAFRLNANLFFSGNGIVDANASAMLGSASFIFDKLPVTSDAVPSTGTGTLEGSRGDAHVVDGTVELRGERDIFGKTFDSKKMATAERSLTSWKGGVWNASTWTGTGSATTGWQPITWTVKNWAGSAWSGSRWRDMAWDGSRWRGAGWSGSRWRGASWSDATWSGSRWR